jgi:hypothetical protein
MESILMILMLAILSEAIWGRIKEVIPENCSDKVRRVVNLLGTSILGILVALMTGADIFELLGFAGHLQYIGVVLTGLIVGGGSNYIHDLISKLRTE